MIFCIHMLEVEKPCIGQSISDEKWGKINYWNYQIDMLLPKMSICRHQPHFLTNEQQKVCWQPKKLRCMILHYHKIKWANICCCNSSKKLQRSILHLNFLDFISIPKKIIVLISSNRCGMVGAGLGGLRKGENELSWKKNTSSHSNYSWVSCVFGDQNRDVMLAGDNLRPPGQFFVVWWSQPVTKCYRITFTGT